MNEKTKKRTIWNKGLKGIHLSLKTEFQKGMTPWNKGKKLSKKHIENLRKSHLGLPNKNKGKKSKLSCERHPNWKGDAVGYHALHIWIKRNFGIPYKCENKDCVYPRMNARNKLMDKPTRYEWANIDSKYSRNRKDWIMMCPSCHRKYDYENKK